MKSHRIKASLLVVFALAILLACTIGGSTSAPAEGAKDVTPIESKQIQLDSSGGSFQVGGATISIGVNNIPSPGTLTLELYAAPALDPETAAAQSDVYAVSGLPTDFQGGMQVTLPIPDGMMQAMDANDPARAQKVTLKMGVPVYAPSAAGIIYREVPLDAQVDLSTKRVTAQVDFVHSMAGGAFGKMAAPAFQFEAGLYTSNNSYFRLYYDEQEETAKADSHNFTISIPPGVGSDVIATLTDTLETSKARIEEMGFSFSPFGPSNRFSVNVQDCDYKDGKFGLYGDMVAVDGMYSHPWGNSSVQASYLCLNSRLFGDLTTMKATAGHELMHLFQYITYADRGFSVFSRFTMLDEAAAVWFESLVAGEEDYLPNVALNSLDFIRKPWFFSAGGKDAQDLGYGASWFLRYLVNEYGEDLVYPAYSGGYSTGETALGTSVVDNSDTILGQAFADFLPVYLLYGDSLAPGLGESDEMSRFHSTNLVLKKSSESDIVLTFSTRLPGVEKTDGMITPDGKLDPPPVAVVTRTLGGLNADFFIFSLDSSSPILQEPGLLTLQVSTSQLRSGVMVYGIPSEGAFADADALASSSNYLSSDGEATLVIPNFSAVGGDTDYDQIMVIFFNMNDDLAETSQIDVALTWNLVKTDRLGVALTADQWKYPETICDLQPSGCRVDALTRAPACIMGDSSGGGGGGGGEGESSVDNRSSCSPIPDWCWQCGDAPGGWQFTNKYRLFVDSVAESMTFILNEEGIVTAVLSESSMFSSPPDVLTHNNGQNLYVEWQNLEDGYNNLGYVILEGNLTAAGGSGFWRMGHPGPGDSIFGQWTALPCDQMALTSGFGCVSVP